MSLKRLVVLVLATGMSSIVALGQTTIQKPANCLASPNGTGGITVTCSPVAGASSYTVVVRDSVTHAVVRTYPPITLPQLTSAATDALPIPTSADIDVTASSSTAVSLPSTVTVALPPMAPTGVQGLPGLNKVTVSWAPSPNATSYQVVLSNGMTVTVSGTSYVFGQLQAATSYTVKVAGINSIGRGAFSPAVIVSTAVSGK